MARIQPRDYLTFRELMARWQISEDDLRHAIICGALKPCIRLNGSRFCYQWWEQSDGELLAMAIVNQDGERVEFSPEGWNYLQKPSQTAPFDCVFYWATDDRDPEMSDNTLSNWYSLHDHQLTLEVVKNSAVFLNEEVKKYEADNSVLGGAVKNPTTEKPLGKRERDTLLTIIAVLCKEAELDYTKASKTAVLIHSTAAGMCLSIGESTIRDHLKEIPNALATRMK